MAEEVAEEERPRGGKKRKKEDEEGWRDRRARERLERDR